MFLSTFLPTRCAGCRAPGASPCGRCVGRLVAAPPGPLPGGLDECRSLLAYEDVGRLLVTNLKFRRDRTALAWLAAGMAELLPPPPGVVVTWAPTTVARRRQRGFDQAELLARAVSHLWAVPCRPLLARRAGPPQTGRSVADRRSGPLLLARAGSGMARGAPVVVVDDVVTTGSTLEAAARALAAVEVASLVGLTAARTPRHGAAPPCVLPRPHKVERFAQVPSSTGRLGA